MSKQPNIPALRFPGFKGDWERKKLGEMTTFSKGKGISKSDVAENGKLECIRYGELYTRYGETIDEVFSKTNISSDRLVLSEANDVIIPASGETQLDIATASCVLRDGIALGGDLNILKTKSNGVFLSYYLNNKKKQDIANLAQGISVVHLYSSQLSLLEMAMPAITEQQKIASFFTAIDKKIALLKQQKDRLEEYKKGVMQELFSKKLRFKDKRGKEYPEWEKKKFADLFSFVTTNSFSRDNLNYVKGSVRNLHYGDIHTKFSSHFNITSEYVPFINGKIDLKKISKESYCKEGDLVIADASEDYADVGKSIELIDLNEEKVLAGLHTILARPDKSKLSLGFSGHLMKSEFLRMQIMKIAQGSKVLSISATRLSGLTLFLPERDEQTRIADFLSALDNKINKAQVQIDKAMEWKKGLLQKMFV